MKRKIDILSVRQTGMLPVFVGENVQRSTLNAQRSEIVRWVVRFQKKRQAASFQGVLRLRKVGCWTLDVERWVFSL